MKSLSACTFALMIPFVLGNSSCATTKLPELPATPIAPDTRVCVRLSGGTGFCVHDQTGEHTTVEDVLGYQCRSPEDHIKRMLYEREMESWIEYVEREAKKALDSYRP
jgi:hypothetical protein